MRRSSRNWLHFTLPLLAVGALALVLLPGKPATVGVADIHTAAPAARPVQVAAAPVQPAAAPAPAPATIEVASAPAPAVVTPVSQARPVLYRFPEVAPAVDPGTRPAATILSRWSDYIKTPLVTAHADLPDGHIGASAVNGRSGPSSGADKVFVVAAGEAVKIGESSGGWVHVYRQSGEDGWIYGRYLAGQSNPDVTPTPSAPAQAAPPARVASAQAPGPAPVGRLAHVHDYIPVRTAPAGYARQVFMLQPGDSVRVADSRGPWLLVVTPEGASGWILPA